MKTIKKVLFITLLLVTQTIVMAQKNMQDVIYLKNGGITRGTILEMVIDDHIKIETEYGNIYVYKMSEVEKYAKEPFYKNGKSDFVENTGIKRGYYGVVEFATGFCFGYETKGVDRKLNIINGYRVNPWFAAGVGFGLRYYPEDGFRIPVFADLRTNLLNKRKSPYLSLDMGYAFNPGGVTKGGFMMAPTIGVSVRVKNRTSLNLGLCYEMQRSVYYEDYYAGYNYYSYTSGIYTKSKPITFHSISFLFGVSF